MQKSPCATAAAVTNYEQPRKIEIGRYSLDVLNSEHDELKLGAGHHQSLDSHPAGSKSEWSDEDCRKEATGGAESTGYITEEPGLENVALVYEAGLTDAEGAPSDVNSLYNALDVDDTSISSRASSRQLNFVSLSGPHDQSELMKQSNTNTMSINKIHVNNTTHLSLNDRFTAIQSITPTQPASPVRRRRTQSSSSLSKLDPNVSLANRKLLELLDKKHKMRAALKLKRRSVKTVLPMRPRIRNRIGLRKGSATTALRLTPSGRLSRSNSLTNVATMKADLVQTAALRRSNSTSSLAGRLGARRASIGGGPSGVRRRIKRNNIVRASSRQNLTRSNSTASLRRSNSRVNLRRSNSRLNLRRSNSRLSISRSNSRNNLNRVARGSNIPQRRPGRPTLRTANTRKRADSQRRSNSVSSRLGVKKVPLARDRIRAANIRGNIRGGRPRRGRGGRGGNQMTRRNSTGSVSNLANTGGGRQGRLGRPRGRGSSNSQRGRSRSRSRGRYQQNGNRGNRSSSRGRGRGRGRGQGTKVDINKEDLDKELDQYMATTRIGLDNEMDIL